jgi:hypothetical protein
MKKKTSKTVQQKMGQNVIISHYNGLVKPEPAPVANDMPRVEFFTVSIRLDPVHTEFLRKHYAEFDAQPAAILGSLCCAQINAIKCRLLMDQAGPVRPAEPPTRAPNPLLVPRESDQEDREGESDDDPPDLGSTGCS